MKKSILFLLGMVAMSAIGAPAARPVQPVAKEGWAPYLLHKSKVVVWEKPKEYAVRSWRWTEPARHKVADLGRGTWKRGKRYGYDVTVRPAKWTGRQAERGWHKVVGGSRKLEADL